MAFENEIRREYIFMRDSLKISFPEAYAFLIMIENSSNKGFHVGTHKNLHLYFNDSFLFYFKNISYRVIEVSSRPNGSKKKQINYNPDTFFTLWLQRLDESGLNPHKAIELRTWKKNKVDHCKITISHSSDSQRIFDTIIETLEQISQ